MLDFPRSVRSAFAFVALCTITSVALAGGPKNKKLSDDVEKPTSSGTVSVIIQYKNAPSSTDLSHVSSMSGSVKGTLTSIHGVQAVVPQSALNTLTQNANVSYISLDRPLAAKQASTTSAEYTVEPINAPAAWAKGYIGTGIGVAVIDSGVSNVPDLGPNPGGKPRIVYSQSFVPGQLQDANDHFGHGTHVAGLIAGNGNKSYGKGFFRTFYGGAPNANIINLRVLDDKGAGTDSAVIAGIERAIALKTTYNIRVINLSIGRPVYESFALDPLCQAVEQAWKAGIVVVVAAGNDGRDEALNAEGYGTIEAPGNDPYALTVGAIKTMGTATITDDQIASYSSKGPTFIDHIAKPDILAPGNVVSSLQVDNSLLAQDNPMFVTLRSFYVTKSALNDVSQDYIPLSGTSMASGVASGAVADLLQAVPTLTPDQAKAFLMRSGNRTYLPATSVATDPKSGLQYTAHNDILTVGAGYLDVAATISSVQANAGYLPTGTAMSPLTAYEPSQNRVYLMNFPGSLWGTKSGASTAVLTWTPADVYGAKAMGGITAPRGAEWGWSPLYGPTNVTGQPVVAGTAGAGAVWGSNPLQTVNDTAAFTALWGNGTPLWGVGTPLWGVGSADLGTGTPLWGVSTPLWGVGTPLWGVGTPLWGVATPLWGVGTPLWGVGTPLWGVSTPLWGTSTPEASSALWGTSTTASTSTGWGASTPQSSSTPLWGVSLPYEY